MISQDLLLEDSNFSLMLLVLFDYLLLQLHEIVFYFLFAFNRYFLIINDIFKENIEFCIWFLVIPYIFSIFYQLLF